MSWRQPASHYAHVVHGHVGLDEISIVEPTKAAELKDGEIRELEIRPNEYGIQHTSLVALQVGDAKESLALVEAALGGEPGPAAEMVALNAGAAIYESGRF